VVTAWFSYFGKNLPVKKVEGTREANTGDHHSRASVIDVDIAPIGSGRWARDIKCFCTEYHWHYRHHHLDYQYY